MYRLNDCIRFGLIFGALLGLIVETVIALRHGEATAVQLLLRTAHQTSWLGWLG